jgi:peptidyl-dipeptidase Dcp
MTNPLRTSWDTPFELPPFDLIEDEHFAPALDAALIDARSAIAAI